MMGLGLVSSYFSGGGPSKEEKQEIELKAKGNQAERDLVERDLEERKRAFGDERLASGDQPEKENKSSVCLCMFVFEGARVDQQGS